MLSYDQTKEVMDLYMNNKDYLDWLHNKMTRLFDNDGNPTLNVHIAKLPDGSFVEVPPGRSYFNWKNYKITDATWVDALEAYKETHKEEKT